MRLFVAVWPVSVGDRSSRSGGRGAAGGQRAAAMAAGSPVALTLAFLGEVDEATVPRLQAGLARSARRADRTELQLAGAGRFGRNVLWVGVAGAAAPLTELAGRASAAARRAGIVLEDRQFHPHLTVARGRDGCDLRPWARALASYAGPSWPMAQVSLVRSTLGPRPSYTELASWPIGRG